MTQRRKKAPLRPLRHFLLVFDHGQEKLISQQEFDGPEEAVQAYSATERRYENTRDMEIVLIGSDSLETVKRTHANYFGKSRKRIASKYLKGL